MNATERANHRTGAGASACTLHAAPYTALPAAPLRPCISHYWLCLNNADTHHAVLPDGAVDIVWQLGATDEGVIGAVSGALHGGINARGLAGGQSVMGSVNDAAAHPHGHRASGRLGPPWGPPQQPQVFGSSRTRTLWPLRRGCHYMGIRFWPGQARHFLDAPAGALTGTTIPADAVLPPTLRGLCPMGTHIGEQLAAAMAAIAATSATRANPCPAHPSRAAAQTKGAAPVGLGALWAQLDALLLAHVQRCPPRPTRIDALLRHMQATPAAEHSWRVAPLAAAYGKSRRQFERQFVDAVGLSPKCFSEVLRFQRALALLAQAHWPLAQIAVELGYADQSHFSRAFARLYGAPPARARRHAAFVQDVQHLAAQNDVLLSH